MKRLICIWLGVLGVIGSGYGQTTFSWRNDQNPIPSANWANGSPIYWWNGSTAVMPTGAEILSFDGFSTNMTSVNNLGATNRYRIIFENAGSPGSRILNGSTTNVFYDYNGNTPAIINNSGVQQTIYFPFLNGNSNGANRLEINAANGNLNIGSTIAASGGTRNLVAKGAGNISFSGIITNGFGSTLNFIKEGIGTTTLSANNTFTGTTSITAGTLRLGAGSNNRLSSFTSINMSNIAGATLDLNNNSQTISGLSGGGPLGGNVLLGWGTLIVNTDISQTFAGVISGTGGLTKSGSTNAGTLILSGANTYTGSTTVSNGILQLGASNTISNSSQLVLSGGTFSTGSSTGHTEAMGTLRLSENSTIALGTGIHSLTFSNSNATVWTNNKKLTITGWNGSACQSGTEGKIYVGVGGLTATQLAEINFNGYEPGARILSDGELVPAGVGAISGNISVNAGAGLNPPWITEAMQVYSITAVNGATSYTWSVPSGATISGGSTGRSVSLVFSCSSQSGDITVTANGGSCNSYSSSLSVSIKPIGTGKPVISGSDSVLEGSTSTYIATIVGDNTNLSYFNWSGPLTTNNWIKAGNNPTFAIPCDSLTGNFRVTTTNSNGCTGTTSDDFPVKITQVGAASVFNTGTSNVCVDSTYKYQIGGASGATAYTWEVPAGSTFPPTSTRAIDVTWGSTSGNVKVTPRNGSCEGLPRSFPVTVYTAVPAAPTTITQANPSGATICPGTTGVTYTIATIANALSYAWTVPAGAFIVSGNGTISITVNWGTAISGNVTVRAVNPCGASSAPASLAVTVSNIPPPFSPSPQTFCSGATIANLAATGTSIQWYASASGGTALPGITVLVDGNTYYASETVSGCESYRAAVVVNLNSTGNWTGITNTDWHTGTNWCTGAAPEAGTAVVIPQGVPHYPIISGANATAVSVSIASGATLEMSNARSLIISNNGNLINNGTFTSGNGTVEFLGAGSIEGITTSTFNNVIIQGAVNFGAGLSTINGTLTINNGGSVIANAPNYGGNAKLLYNAGGTFARGLEWNYVGSPVLGTTAGYPNDIQISNNTTIDYPNDAAANTTNLSIARDLTIDAGSSLYLDFGAGISSGALTIGRNITIGGNLSLGDGSGGNLFVGGNFSKTGGTWNGNGRELIFNGTVTQAFSCNDNIIIHTLRNNNTSINVLNLNSSFTIGNGGGAYFNGTGKRTVIASGVSITFNDGTTLATTLGITTVNGTLLSTGTTGLSTADQTSFTSLKFSSTGIFNHNTTRSGSTSLGPIPSAEWQAGSLCTVTGLTTPNGGSWPSEGMGQTFANFTWNTPLMTTSPVMGLNLNVNGTLTISSTGSSEIRLTSGANRFITTANYNQGGGILNLADGAFSGTLNVTGNFTVGGGIIQTTGSSITSGIIFNGSSNQSLTFSGGTVTGIVNFSFNNTAGYNLTGTLPINNNATAKVNTGVFSGPGNFSYGNTNSTLDYGGITAYTTSNYEFPNSNGPVNLRINNAAGITLHAVRSLPTSGILTLVNGIVITNTTNLLTINNTASGAVSGGSVTSYINGPLDRRLTNATVYNFPVGNASYLPVGISGVAGTNPVLRIQAFSANNGGTYDGSLSSISSSEYWAASLTSGTLTSATIGLTRQIPVGTNSSIARCSSVNGVYGSIGGNAAGNTISNGITNGVLGFFVMGVGNGVYYWTNNASMNWETASDWLITNGPTLIGATIPALSPNAGNSSGITVQNGHTVTILSDVTADQTIIQPGATLVNGAGTLTISDGIGTDLDIYGTFRHNSSITATISGQGVIRTNGMLEVTNNSSGASSYGTSNNLTYENASTFYWNVGSSAIFATANATYFPNSPEGIIPIFRTNTPNMTVGAGSNTVINGILQVDANTITFNDAGTKTLRNGIMGTGNVSQTSTSGSLIINGSTSNLGGTGTITLNTNGLRISNGVCTLLNNKPFNATSGAGTFTVGNGATLNAQTYSLTGTGLFTQEASGTLQTANTSGVNGSIALSGAKIFTPGANYTFDGTSTQLTGTLMGNVIGALTINNPATVNLTNNTHTTAVLNLNNGLFNIGTGQNLHISSGGSVNATAGDFVSGVNAGTIFFNTIGGGSFSGNSNPYNVRIQGPVNFGNGIVTIQNGGTLRIDQNGGVVINAPYYSSGSTLQYSTSGFFERFLEWNAGSGRGNPHHVLLSNGTILSPARNDLSYAATTFLTNGNLTIESGSSLHMDYNLKNMTQPLQIGGNLQLEGNLSASGVSGGDIKLAGNWTRTSTGAFSPNNRAVFFTGNGNTQVIMNTSALAANRIETFPYFIIDKAAGDVRLSGSPNTTNVLVNGASGNVLEIMNGNIDLNGNLLELGGTGGDFRVDGANQKRIYSATAAIFRLIGNKNITGTNAGNLLFDNLVTVEIAAGLNFGRNNLNIHVTTINAILQINPGGYADVYAPYYGPNGILVYNTGGPNYLRRVEWRGEAGEPGYPNDVIIQSNTTLYAGGPNAGESINNALSTRRDVTIQAGSSLNMSGTYNMNRDLIVGRNLTINGNLTNSTIGGIDIYVGKDWTRGSSGTFTNLNNGAVFFNTNQPATISNSGAIETFPYVIVDKAGSADNMLTLAAPVNISGKFTLSSGRVITNTTNVLSITNPLTDDVANGVGFIDGNQGYVDGPLRRNVQNTPGDNSYTFPVGTLSGGTHFIKRFRLRDVTESATPNYFLASYYRATPPLGGAANYLFQDELLGIHKDEYWNVDRESGAAKGRLVFPYTNPGLLGWQLTTGAPTSPPDNANVAIVKGYGNGIYNFTDPTNGVFSNFGTEPQARFYAIDGDIQSRLIETFSPFTFGYGYNGILPIKLLTFTATLQNGSGLLQWKIADESDLRQFEVEYSTNGQRFSQIGTVMPNGGLSFRYLHKNLAAGIHYYRLRIVEKDGQSSFSKTEIIQVGRQQTYITGLLQNPVIGGQAILQVNSANSQHAEAVVLDAIGRMLLKQRVQLMAGPNNVNLTVLPLPAGTYRILFRTQDGVEKVMPMIK